MENVQNFIANDLFSSLNNDNKVNEQFEIAKWDEIKSLYLRYKENNKDGFIITTTPYFNDDKICFNLTIIPVDCCKEPKPSMIRFVTNIRDNTIDSIKNYLTQMIFLV